METSEQTDNLKQEQKCFYFLVYWTDLKMIILSIQDEPLLFRLNNIYIYIFKHIIILIYDFEW